MPRGLCHRDGLRMIPGNCYLAGSWADRPRLRGIRDELAALGIEVTSRWLDHEGVWILSPSWAAKDLADIDAAQSLIVFTDVPSTAGGFHWESGYAFGRNKPIIGVGPRTCLFHHLVPESDWY